MTSLDLGQREQQMLRSKEKATLSRSDSLRTLKYQLHIVTDRHVL